MTVTLAEAYNAIAAIGMGGPVALVVLLLFTCAYYRVWNKPS